MQISEPTLDHHISGAMHRKEMGVGMGGFGVCQAERRGRREKLSRGAISLELQGGTGICCLLATQAPLVGAHEEWICCLLHAQQLMGSCSGPVGWSSRPHRRVGETRRRRVKLCVQRRRRRALGPG